jgi:hypothetical protein
MLQVPQAFRDSDLAYQQASPLCPFLIESPEGDGIKANEEASR